MKNRKTTHLPVRCLSASRTQQAGTRIGNMKRNLFRKLLIIFLPFLLLVRALSWGEGTWQAPWHSIALDRRSFLYDVYFTDEQRGWLIGMWGRGRGGFIAHTDGDTWQTQFYDEQFRPEAVQFLTATEGWVAGNRQLEDKETEGILLYTRDGGEHWEERHRFPMLLYSLQFVTEQHGWAVGYRRNADDTYTGVILATSNSGEDWTPQYEGRNEVFVLNSDLCFIDVNNGWVLGSVREQDVWKSLLLHTTDGGKNWTRMSVEHLLVEGKWIAAIDFISAEEGWIVVTKGIDADQAFDLGIWWLEWTIFHTEDGGQTWTKQATGTEKHSSSPSCKVHALNEDNVWIGISAKTVLHTEDGGTTWDIREYKWKGYNIRLVHPEKGEKRIYREWGINTQSIYFLDSQRGWIVGDGMLTTTDGGSTWHREEQKPFGYQDMNDVFFVTSDKGWAVGQGGAIFHTDDAGVTWKHQESSTSVDLHGIHFVSAEEGWVVGDESTILHTIDGGHTWVKQHNDKLFSLVDVQFTDAQNGWIVGRRVVHVGRVRNWEGIILHTVDGGMKWKTVKDVPVDKLRWLGDVHFIDAQTGWIAGTGSLLYTDDGGKSWQNRPCAETGSYRAVWFLDALTGWITNWEGVIRHTTDGGFSWHVQSQGLTRPGDVLYFANHDEGWMFGRQVLHTDDGGQTWAIQELPLEYDFGALRSICYGGPETLWAVGEEGMLLRYSDSHLRVIEPSYWAVEALDKDAVCWGNIKERPNTATSHFSLTTELYPNYPNPFNLDTWIPFELAEPAEVIIRIYNIKGQLIRTLNLGYQSAGFYVSKERAAYWNGHNQQGESAVSGVYFYILQAGDFIATRKMVLTK